MTPAATPAGANHTLSVGQQTNGKRRIHPSSQVVQVTQFKINPVAVRCSDTCWLGVTGVISAPLALLPCARLWLPGSSPVVRPELSCKHSTGQLVNYVVRQCLCRCRRPVESLSTIAVAAMYVPAVCVNLGLMVEV